MQSKRLLIAAPLGFGTILLIGYLRDHLSGGAQNTAELFLIPGAMVGMIVSAGGVHGDNPTLWAAAVVVSNLCFYIALWYGVLWVAARVRPRTVSDR